ncbi:trafficking kinesin-binding protein 1 isoform X1 [Esox lucius]|uniref:trafficking kinesin-binding protein 1 isoform X1 n=1 Tax=Esox lucius TaxID=8010 RepID=UPI001476A17D|nr:trafficking kinesin-binding protein 1 isoform X1 [Esox lucius]XP_034150768.1 trafficking kinesin-binding protein 1 isoform X1 [Esox lucius]
MTKTYNDIDAVTRLLEEKERDLELAARIGQSLLRKNRTLTEQNDFLEEQVGRITEEVAQLHHELNLKDELLQFYTHTVDDGEEESTVSSPICFSLSLSRVKRSKLLGLSGSGADSMQRKLRELEEENLSLRTEACHLKTETETYEEKEQQLVNDCVKELKQSSLQINTIAEELARKTEDAMRQQEEITHLLSQIVDLQKKAKSYALENEELSQHLGAAKDAQRQLTAELTDLDDKYTECLEMLHEAQEEVKNLRNRSYPAGTPRRFHPLGLYPMDSLAAEIEGTMRKEMSLEDPECEEQKEHHKRVFETVKNINQTVRQRSPVPSNANIPGSNQASSLSSTHSSGRTTPRGDVRGDGVALDNRQQSMLMESAAANQDSVEARAKKAAGVEDLRLALRRLSLRRQNNLSERRFFEEERGRRRGGGVPQDGSGGHGGGMTPSDSIMSLGTLHLWASRPYLPDKLQIVKPLEGSATLHHWQQLAQPHLGVILDARPGVVPKGFRPLELELEQVYPWGGFEEDEPGDQYFQSLPTSSVSSSASPALHPQPEPPPPSPPPSHPSSTSTPSPSPHLSNTDPVAVYYPGKCMAHTSSTYTFTTCRILHPTDELTRVTPSVNPGLSSSSCVMTSSILATPAGTPSHPPRRMSLLRPSESSTNLRDATRTTSTSLGLVRLLQERGISAAMYQHPTQGWERAGGSGLGSGGVLLSTSIAPNLQPAPHPVPLRPTTPPNSPTGHNPPTSGTNTPAGFDFKSPSYDNFLASKPARSILKDVAGTSGGSRSRRQQRGRDCESQTDVSVTVHNLNLVDKVKRLGVAGGPPGHGGVSGGPSQMLGPLGGLRRSGSPFGPDSMRRNRSYPAMVGASMAMKGPGPQEDSELLLPPNTLPKQKSLK